MSTIIRLCLVLVLMLHVVVARAADAGGACDATGQCSNPFPYCDPELNVCVECVGDRNCPGKVCDRARGRCSECVVDGDCVGGAPPYCDRERGVCVWCLGDGNCAGTESLPHCDTGSGTCVQCTRAEHCAAGPCTKNACTTCGDGVCQPDELVIGDGYRPESVARQCFDDCAGECPTRDLGSELGSFSFDAMNRLSRWEIASCPAAEASGPDVSFRWTAPHTGRFSFDTSRSTVSTVALAVVSGECREALRAISPSCNFGKSKILMDLAKDQSFVFVLDTSDRTSGILALTIQADGCHDPRCMPPPRDAGTPEAATPGDADSGRLCAPGREVACACESGAGTKRCNADGNGFGSCSCNAAAATGAEAASDCGCRAPGRGRSAGSLALALAIAALARLRGRGVRREREAR